MRKKATGKRGRGIAWRRLGAALAVPVLAGGVQTLASPTDTAAQ
ncbi:hypothetical protein ACQPYK_40155 [Streptosporangium sp. CA-135522]